MRWKEREQLRDYLRFTEYRSIVQLKKLDFIVESINAWYERHGYTPRVLDVGCGRGDVALPLASLGCSILGVDIDRSAIKHANRKYMFQNACFLRVDAENLIMKDEFDVIICSEIFEHLSNPSRLAASIANLLKDEGLIIITIPNGYGPWELLSELPMRLTLKLYDKVSGKRRPVGTKHSQNFTLKGFRKLLESQRMVVKKICHSDFISWFPRLKESSFAQLDCKISDIFPHFLVSGWYFICRKKARAHEQKVSEKIRFERKNEKKVVGISKVRHLQNTSEVKRVLFDLLNRMKAKVPINIPSKAKIMIKPNICHVKGCETGATVDPSVVKLLVEWLFQNYDVETITIGEADATELNVDVAFKVLGWEEMFKSLHNVHLLNLTKDECVNIELDGLYLRSLHMSKTYMESDFLISVAKLKTHNTCGISCVLKNQYGANPAKYKARYHECLDEAIHDMNKVRLPDLCLVDGIIGMEGSGPINGMPIPLGLLVVGNDAVSVDHTCARVMGFDPDRISHLKLAVKKKLGSTSYDIFGEKLAEVKVKLEFVPRWKKIVAGIYKSKVINRFPLWKWFLQKMLKG